MSSNPPDSNVPDEELESFLADVNREFEGHQAELERTERAIRRAIAIFVLGVCFLILVSIVGCGGSEDDEHLNELPCRMDLAGPPAPGDDRPLCKGYI